MHADEGRLIALHAGNPEENMAIDQALLESADVSGVPVLRLYSWSTPTLSLGYFQAIARRGEHVESAELACVRRATGGGAIVHHHDLTYSIAIPTRSSLAGPRLDLYRQTHLAAVKALADFGICATPQRMLAGETQNVAADPFLCFQRRSDEDLIVSGYKVLGSAQRKARRAVLQHGSLLVRSSPWAPQLPGLWDLTSRSVAPSQFAESFANLLSETLSIRWKVDGISAVERSRAEDVKNQKYASNRWLLRR